MGELIDNVGDYVEQEVELFGFASEVFGGEQVEGDQLDIELGAPSYEFGDFFRPGAVSVADVGEPGGAGKRRLPSAITATCLGRALPSISCASLRS